MVDIVEQICIKSCEISAENGDHFAATQGERYITTVPTPEKDTITIFSTFWVPLPKDNFVVSEQCPYTKRRAKRAQTRGESQ